MTDNLSLTATRRAADASIATFKSAFGTVLLLEAIAALLLLLAPGLLIAELPEGAIAGSRLTGALLVWAVLLQVPGRLDPVRHRLPVMIGMAGRALVGATAMLLGGGFLVVGIVVLAVALGLLVLFHGMVASVVSSRP